MADIRFFVCCHRPAHVPAHPLLVPLQVGTALAEERFSGYAHDDEGENISQKNRFYCELTAQYWAWKNARADYLGFFHYRRYLYPDTDAKLPYRVERNPSEALLQKLGFDDFCEFAERYDLILPKAENMRVSVREHYADAPNQRASDLALAEAIVSERHPKLARAQEAYLSGTMHYFGNIFIMRRSVFEDYCAWLFPLLEEYDEQVRPAGLSPRVDGYLAERLLGVYATYRRERKDARIAELPRVHFCGADYARRCVVNALLPPGSERRAKAKALGRKYAWLRCP